MSNEYEFKLTAEINYGKDIGKQRHTVEADDAGLNIFDLIELYRSLTLSIGYHEENWKHAIINAADLYMQEVRGEDISDVTLDDVDWDDNTEYMVTHDYEHHIDTKETMGVRGCPVTGHTATDMNQYSTHAVTEENC